jgi:hypothetical protein
LHPTAVRRVAETTVLALGRVKAKREVAVGEVDQHAEVAWLDALRDRLDGIHFKRDLLLELV